MLKLSFLLLLVGCAAPRELVRASDPTIWKITLDRANAYVVRGAHTVVVDTGWTATSAKLEAALAALGVPPKDIALVIVTHGHGDHAGGAARLRQLSGARVVAGAGDTAMLAAGHNTPLVPMSGFARLIRASSDQPFTSLVPDDALAGDLDLAPWGIAGVVRLAPGHTPGSLVVLLRGGDALVGDLVRGELLSPHTPARHFFHDDCRAAEAHLAVLVDAGVQRLLVGHGGPLEAKRARDALRAHPCP